MMNEMIVHDMKTGAVYRQTIVEVDGIPHIKREVIQDAAPTQIDRVEAQATYTAMMTDTLLGE